MVVRGDFLVVGDLLKSVCMLKYDAANENIDVVAQDYNTCYLTSVGIVDDNVFVAAENLYNLYSMRRNTSAMEETELRRLQIVGEWYLGDIVNKIDEGGLLDCIRKASNSHINHPFSRLPGAEY